MILALDINIQTYLLTYGLWSSEHRRLTEISLHRSF